MKNHRTSGRLWSYYASFLLLAVMGNILFGGIKGLLEYRHGMEPDMDITLTKFHFFTKDYLKRLYQRLTVEDLPNETVLPSFHIFADETDLESLDSDLPGSGKTQFIQGHIDIDNPQFNSAIQFRYRGGLGLHWLYKKKSFRVKLPPYTTYLGERQFNLVNPSTIYTITDWLSYEMSKSIGLLTPDYFPARVFINGKTNGLHFFLSKIDESFLRKNKRMPGSIYSGDTIYTPSPFGADAAGMAERIFPGKEDGISLMWKDERLWEKEASRNAESRQDRMDIKKLVEIINLADPLTYMQEFDTYFDKNKFYLFWGIDSIVGGFHHDLYHNHKLYFDPYKGKFEPIQWDVRFWSTGISAPVYPLLKQVMLNPVLDYERNLIVYKLWEEFLVQTVIDEIDEKRNLIVDELAADPYRQRPDENNKLFVKDKDVPFTIKEFNRAIEFLKLTYKTRHEVVKNTLDDSSIFFTLKPVKKGVISLEVAVSGNSPADINLWSIIPEGLQQGVFIERNHQNSQSYNIPIHSLERLYPGKTIKEGNSIGRADFWGTISFGNERLEPSALHYSYQIRGVDIDDFIGLTDFEAVNSITGKAHKLYQVVELPSDSETGSVHPWSLETAIKNPVGPVILSGEINILQDTVYSENQQIKILPGTVFKIGKGKSLVFYGKVVANGKKGQPIRFIQKVKGEPWGSIVIQGRAASGSELSYIDVSGGSLSTHRLVNYPGQINIHDVDSFRLEHCRIGDNLIGDDALHVTYSSGLVSNCVFENTAFDALDMDIVDVEVSHSRFFNIGNDAIDLMTSNVAIRNVSVDGAGDKCFSIGEDSHVTIKHSQLTKCNSGIAVKDESSATLEDLTFKNLDTTAIALYRKNPRYGSGGVVRGRLLQGISLRDIDVDDESLSYISEEDLLPAGNN